MQAPPFKKKKNPRGESAGTELPLLSVSVSALFELFTPSGKVSQIF